MATGSASLLTDERIAALGDWRGATLARVRAIVREADPAIAEEWKWRGVPVWSRGGIVCTGETYKNVVKLTFAKGAALADPAGLFNASLDGKAAAVAEQVRVRVHELLFESGQLASVSIGVAEGRSGMGLAQLLEFADVALYQAKGAGRNAVRTSTIPAEAAGRVSRGARRISSGVQRAELPFRSFPAVRGS